MERLHRELEFLHRSRLPLSVLYLVCPPQGEPWALAAGVARLLPEPIHLLELAGDYLEHHDHERLVEPLLRGKTVLLLTAGTTLLAARILNTWIKATRRAPSLSGHGGSYSDSFGRHGWFTLDRGSTPGTLAIVQVGGEQLDTVGRPTVVLVATDDECRELAAPVRSSDAAFCPIGRPSRAGTLGLTMPQLFKELCLLHARDPAPTPATAYSGPDPGPSLGHRDQPLTWSDIQRLLSPGEPAQDHHVQRLHRQGLVDDDKLDFYLGALDALEEYQLPRVHSCIWEAVWVYQFRQDGSEVFRGHASDAWRLDNTLFRRPPGADHLDAGTLERRLRSTNAFLTALAGEQERLLGGELTEDEQLAVAQHYGFPTPLLDLTHSLRVAAFFASLEARRRDVSGWVGAIHRLTLRQDATDQSDQIQTEWLGLGGFRLLPSAGIRVGSWRIVEPHLPESEDRIGRQAGLFIADYDLRHLRQMSQGPILFHQHRGDVFEDPASGLTEEQLLRGRGSRLHTLASRVSRRFEAARRVPAGPLAPVLGRIGIPEQSVLGSAGTELPYLLRHFADFFRDLHDALEDQEFAQEVERVLQRYFADVRLGADVGRAYESGPGDRRGALSVALARLEELAGTPPRRLVELVAPTLPDHDSTYRGPDLPYHRPDTPAGQRERIAAACALYLAGWQNLVWLGGFRATGLTMRAREVLLGHRDPW